jgi:hypothetical protein
MTPETSNRKFAGTQLIPGKTYRVIRDFTDHDGFSLRIERDGRATFLRLQWRPETQGHIVSAFSDDVEEL